MVEAGQGFGWLRGIEEAPNSTGHPDAERGAVARNSWLEIFAPSPASAQRAPVASVAAIEVQGVDPEVAQIDCDLSCTMKLKENFPSLRASALRAPVLMIAGTELKEFVPEIAVFDGTDSGSAMRANVMSLTMPPTPFTRRSYANSMGHFLFLDSGACRNMVFDPALLINWRAPPAGTYQFVAADGVRLDVIGYGDIEMENFRIPGVYLVRGLTVNLISVGDLARSHKICCSFAGNECNLMLADGSQIGGAIRRDDNQYLLRFLEVE